MARIIDLGSDTHVLASEISAIKPTNGEKDDPKSFVYLKSGIVFYCKYTVEHMLSIWKE